MTSFNMYLWSEDTMIEILLYFISTFNYLYILRPCSLTGKTSYNSVKVMLLHTITEIEVHFCEQEVWGQVVGFPNMLLQHRYTQCRWRK